jgi:hypothetical protein
MSRIWLGIVMALIGNAACAPTVNTARLQDVKKAALIGYHIEGMAAPDVDESPAYDYGAPTENESTVAAYQTLANALTTKFKWEMTPIEAITDDPFYNKLRIEHQRRTTKYWEGGSMRIEDFMWSRPPQRLTLSERRQLMETFGVDALVTSGVFVRKGKGMSTIIAIIHLHVYDGVDSEPIWSDIQATGQVSTHFKSRGTFEEQGEAFWKTLGYAYETLFKQYDKAVKAAENNPDLNQLPTHNRK